jgi:hypothetical protein
LVPKNWKEEQSQNKFWYWHLMQNDSRRLEGTLLRKGRSLQSNTANYVVGGHCVESVERWKCSLDEIRNKDAQGTTTTTTASNDAAATKQQQQQQ